MNAQTEIKPEKQLLTVSPSPHMHSKNTTAVIMLDVIIALLPLLIWGTYVFGWRALLVTGVTVASCVLFELLWCLILKKPITIGDLSAVVTGLLLAYNLPVGIPLWMPVLGAFFAVVIVKMLFGGIGKNFVNPALAGRAMLVLSFGKAIEAVPGIRGFVSDTEIVTGATPLKSLLDSGKFSSNNWASLFDMFIGKETGVIGEVSAALILAGFVYLLIRKVISWHIPVAYLGTVALFAFFLPAKGFDRMDIVFTLSQLCAGGLMLGAVFMATDYTTSPITKKGRIIFGVGCGLLTVFVRWFGGKEGVSYAILVMNLLVWFIDRITIPRPYGVEKKKLFAGKKKNPGGKKEAAK